MRRLRIAPFFVLSLLTISVCNSFGQSTLQDECAQTAQMDVYSDAHVSEATGDLGGFELALDKPSASPRKALLFVYEGAANGDGRPLALTTDGNNVAIKGTWTEHGTEYPSKKDVVQTHFVKITGTLTPKMFRGTISIEGLEIVNPEHMQLKRAKQIWICAKH